MQENKIATEVPSGQAVYEIPAQQVRDALKAAMKQTGSTFFWIAGLSVINTILVLTKANLMMLGGLGITLVVDVLFSQSGAQLQPIGFGINFTIALMFVVLGMWAGKGSKVAFFVGMGLYALDACLYVFLQDPINIAFHGYFLYLIYNRFKSMRALKAAIANVESEINNSSR